MLTLLTNPYAAVPEALALIALAYGALKFHRAGQTLSDLTKEDDQ